MGKRIFVLIVVLMSISLIGIISVQLYWINNAIESKDAQFDNDVKKAMARASERLKLKEQDLYYNKIKPIFDSKEFLNKAEIKNYLIQQIDTVNNRKFSFGSTIIEEDFKVPLDILNESQFFSNDTIVLTRFTRRNDRFTAQLIADDKSIIDFNEKSFSKTSKFDEWINRKEINDVFNDYRNEFPIHQRISNREINTTLREELEKNNIDIDFKYGVYNNGLATKLKSGYFTIDPDKSYDHVINLQSFSVQSI